MALTFQKRAREGAENCGCIKQLECISLLESINVVELLLWTRQNCISVGLILLLDAASCCTASTCLSLLGIAALYQNLVVPGLMPRSPFPSCPVLEAEQWRPCANQCWGLVLQECFYLYKPGEKRVNCSQIRWFLWSFTKLWYLGNHQTLCESNGLWGEPATWIAQSKFSNLLGTAAVFKGLFYALILWPLLANTTSLVWGFSYFPFTSSVLLLEV